MSAPPVSGYVAREFIWSRWEGGDMLWLILGVILLVIAIAGGTIVHPILFALGILALLVFLAGR